MPVQGGDQKVLIRCGYKALIRCGYKVLCSSIRRGKWCAYKVLFSIFVREEKKGGRMFKNCWKSWKFRKKKVIFGFLGNLPPLVYRKWCAYNPQMSIGRQKVRIFLNFEKTSPSVDQKWCAYKVFWSKSAAQSGVPTRSYTRKIAKIRSYGRKW